MDIRAEITKSIIKLIEDGKAANCKTPIWDKAVKFGMPRNYATGDLYTGVNVPLLWIASAERRYPRNDWMTYLQLQELGAKLKDGSTGTGVMGIHFKMVARKGGKASLAAKPGTGEGDLFPAMKPFWVFNVAQIDGLPEEVNEESQPIRFSPIEQAELLIKSSGADILHGGSRAFYQPKLDAIVMPDKASFKCASNYYAVCLHELAHWTAHESRLNRICAGKLGSDAHAFEELVVEFGSAFVIGHVGLQQATHENHASYIDAWLRVLRSDDDAIFRATRMASAASKFILDKAELNFNTDPQ
jgi:antirestriction protein ArdC